jgi:hypothetical protein
LLRSRSRSSLPVLLVIWITLPNFDESLLKRLLALSSSVVLSDLSFDVVGIEGAEHLKPNTFNSLRPFLPKLKQSFPRKTL